jgi:hypothetical protein
MKKPRLLFLEGIMWADGIGCPQCGNVGDTYKIKGAAFLIKGTPCHKKRDLI